MPAIEGLPEGVEFAGVTTEVRGDVEFVWDHGIKSRRGVNTPKGAMVVKPADGYRFVYSVPDDQVSIVKSLSQPVEMVIRVKVETEGEAQGIRDAVARWNQALGGRAVIEEPK